MKYKANLVSAKPGSGPSMLEKTEEHLGAISAAQGRIVGLVPVIDKGTTTGTIIVYEVPAEASEEPSIYEKPGNLAL